MTPLADFLINDLYNIGMKICVRESRDSIEAARLRLESYLEKVLRPRTTRDAAELDKLFEGPNA